jgi:hypothetical protein
MKTRIYNTQQFIEQSKKNYNEGRYSYDKTVYKNAKTKVIITCLLCNRDFEQLPNNHISGHNGCILCSIGGNKKDTSIFIMKNKDKNIYSYDKTVYKNAKTKVIITCLLCNEDFLQTPDSHSRGHGCPLCYRKTCNKQRIKTTEQFIEDASLIPIHFGKYSYEKTKYQYARKNVLITCLVCNRDFLQTPDNHLSGKGCYFCKNKLISEKLLSSTNEFVQKAKKLPLNDNYSYDKVKYINSKIPVIITCLSCNKDFLQVPTNHLQGSGCPVCNSSRGEKAIENFLILNKIEYKRQVRITGCHRKKTLPFDFGIYNNYGKLLRLIEYQGIQHYKSFTHFGGIEKLNKTLDSDKIKSDYCLENKIPLLIIPYTDFNNVESILQFWTNKGYF